jgi:hypothetical protein
MADGILLGVSRINGTRAYCNLFLEEKIDK